MPNIFANTSFKLDGVSDFTIGGRVFQWEDHFLENVTVRGAKPGQILTATATLSGSGWDMSTLRFIGPARLKAVINDSAAGTGRHIDLLQLNSQGGSKVTLVNTEVNFIRGGVGVDNITTGLKSTKAVLTEAGNDIVTTRAGWVGWIDTSDGNDRVTIGAGGAAHVGTGPGNDIVTTGKGFVDSIDTGSGSDRVTVGTGDVGHTLEQATATT
jgi:hypothetical protein